MTYSNQWHSEMIKTPNTDIKWKEWPGGSKAPDDWDGKAVKFRCGKVRTIEIINGWNWEHVNHDTDITHYSVSETLHADPAPDQFKHESPIRAFTDWKVSDTYALGKGFRPSLAHLVVYLDAMQVKEGWSLVQVLEAATGSPSFLFRKVS